MVFVVLENAKYEKGPTLPDFSLLNDDDLENMARALIVLNLEKKNHYL
jgi:hypothetical protein